MATAVSTAYNYVPFAELIRTAYAEFKAGREKRKVYNITVRELESLDNRGLQDLGIARSDIKRLAREHAYGF